MKITIKKPQKELDLLKKKVLEKKQKKAKEQYEIAKKQVEIQQSNMHFCPNCKILFKDDTNYSISETNNVTCHSCKKQFNLSMFGSIFREKNNSLYYSLAESLKGENKPYEYIKEICQKYYDNDYSYRQIQNMTFFSIVLIQKCISVKKTFDKPRPRSEKRLLKYLKIQDKMDSVSEKIKKALKYGCSYEVIEKLFGDSSKTITVAKNELVEQKENLEPNRKVFLKDDKYYIKEKIKKLN